MLWITQGDNHSCFSMKYWETGDIYVWKIIKYTTICSYLVHVLLSMVVGWRRGEQKLLHPMNPQSQIIFPEIFFWFIFFWKETRLVCLRWKRKNDFVIFGRLFILLWNLFIFLIIFLLLNRFLLMPCQICPNGLSPKNDCHLYISVKNCNLSF